MRIRLRSSHRSRALGSSHRRRREWSAPSKDDDLHAHELSFSAPPRKKKKKKRKR